MGRLLRLALLIGAFALLTAALGWWAPVLLGLVWGWLGREEAHPAVEAGVAAAGGWSLLLLLVLWGHEGGQLVTRLSVLLGVPGPLLLALTIALAFALAFVSAWLGAGPRPAANGRPRAATARETVSDPLASG